jgi:aryl-alcohol dehydrogenase-like predicted oxidoreductase
MTLAIAGECTEAGTAAWRTRFQSRVDGGHFRGFEGRCLSSIGVGTYLGSPDDATDQLYHQAIVRALELGANVIDTAINYRHQRSERTVGAALRDAIARGVVRRDEVLISTKGGFLPFDQQRPRDFGAYIERMWIETGILERADIVAECHAMTPRYLDDQIERSRRNLGLDKIDVYYLHNPETQLDAPSIDRSEFLRRMRAAFERLEQACADGRIGVYGTATWSGYRQPQGAEDRLDLGELIALAQEVGGIGHKFRMIQLPYNLAMTEARTLYCQRAGGRPAPLLDAAANAGLYVMTSGSILQGKLAVGLDQATQEAIGATLATDGQRALQFTRSTPGVGTALVGMKRVAHVEENLALARTPPLAAEAVAAAFGD